MLWIAFWLFFCMIYNAWFCGPLHVRPICLLGNQCLFILTSCLLVPLFVLSEQQLESIICGSSAIGLNFATRPLHCGGGVAEKVFMGWAGPG